MKVGDFVWGLDVTSDKSWCRGTLIAKEEGKYTIRLDENGKEVS